MKNHTKRVSESVLCVVLTLCMLISCMSVGFISTDAALVKEESVGTGSTWTLYLAIRDPQNYYGGSTVKCNYNKSQYGDDWVQTDMTALNKYWAGRNLYSITFTDSNSGLSKLQFQVYNGATHKNQWEVISSWAAFSDTYNNKVFVYDAQTYADTYSTSNTKYGWTKGDYYIYNNITGTWYGGDPSPQMNTVSGDTSLYYYDFYLKKDEKSAADGLLFRFWDASDEEQIGPAWVSTHRSSVASNISASPATNLNNITKWDDKNTAWQYLTSGFTANTFNKVRVYLDVDYNGTGGVWVEKTQLSNLDPTFSSTSFDINRTYDLTSLVGFTSGSNVGTVSYSTYQYYDTSWHDISTPAAWTPSSTSITKLRVTATDAGVVTTSGTTKNAITARTETKETAITVADAAPTITSFTVGGAATKTLNIGETAALASTIKNSNGTVTYTSSYSTKVSIVDGAVKALAPCQNVTITASLTDAPDKTVTVSVNTPTLTFSYSPAAIYAAGQSTTVGTISAQNVHEGTTLSNTTYSITSGNDYATINSSTGEITSTGTAGTVTVTASSTVTYNGVSYSGVVGTATVTVKPLPTVKLKYNVTESDEVSMAYDADASATKSNHIVYKLNRSWKGSSRYNFEVNVTENSSTTNYHMPSGSSAISDSYPLSGTGYLLNSSSGNWVVMNTNSAIPSGTRSNYTIYFDFTDKKLYVEYSYAVSFNKNGYGTSTPATQYVNYGACATQPSDPTETGYTFGGWFTEDACETAYQFTTSVTANRTLYAKWTKNTYTITYPSSPEHYTLSTTSNTAQYGDTVSFTVTPDSTYRIVSVTYTPYGDTAHDATLVNGQYQFSMPAANVTVSVTVIKTYTITLTTRTKDMNGALVGNDVGFTSKTYAINSGLSKPYTVAFTVDAGQSVTFQVAYAAGYGFDSVSGADRTNDTTFSIASASADTTVTVTAKETARTITVKRRYINADGSKTVDSTPVDTLTAGISTQATVSAVPANDLTLQNGDYTFDKFTLPDSGVTANPAPNGSNSFSITATAAATIYIDYRETMHTLTLRVSPEGSGSIKQNGSVVTGTLQVGNVTGVTLKPYPADGYKFAAWNPEGYVTQSPPVPSESDSNPAYTIRINGDSTLTAAFREITHTVRLDFQIYDLDGTTQLQGQTVPSVELQGAGMFTPITVNAPRLNNSEFMTFEIPSEYEDKITLSEGFVLTDRSIEIKATADVRINVKYKISGNVTVYIDMNDNIGTPILNFKYFINSSGQPVMPTGYNDTTNELECSTAGAQEANLPFEMELVTGSESVYKYTIKMAKLRDEFFIGVHKNGNTLVTHLLKIAYIKVENTSYGAPGGFLIDAIATTTGEMWFKADSTNLKAFDRISYGSVTNTIVGLAGDGENSTTHILLNNAIQSVHGTGIHTDEAAEYHVQYAGLYTLSGASSVMNNFHYNLNVRINDQVVQDGVTYYFDKWVTCSRENLTHNAGGYKVDQATEYPSPTMDLNFTTAPVYSASASSTAYIALYKAVTDEDSKVRVRITYHFNDFDTSDGNYVFDDHQENDQYTKVTAASYTKTVTTDTLVSDYDTLKANTVALKLIAQNNVPYIKSNYFDYTFAPNQTALTTVTSSEETELKNQKLILLDAYLTETAHPYKIIVQNGGSDPVVKTGYYQRTVELTAPTGMSNPVWKDSNNNVLASGASYTARFVSSGFNQDANGNDCQIICVEAGTANAAEHTSVVTNSTTTYDYEGSTEYLHHNFYIVDSFPYDANGQIIGELVGGGVLFATTNGTDYRQTNAATYLGNYGTPSEAASVTARQNFISGILNNDYDTEYVAQTINNVGFRYLPFNAKDDVFRYSDIQHAYLTMYEGSNVNSSNYAGQKLRLFSFMVYDSGTNGAHDYHIVCSEGYGEVDRYINHTAS